ncbi:hypothetical protein IAU60_002601 [Kwoniella sp. DSM 27419]
MSHTASLTNHNPTNYATHASFVYSKANTTPVLDLLDARPGERIIDLGCGTGEITVGIYGEVSKAGGAVVGVDANASMLEKAASSSPREIAYVQADIQDPDGFAKAHPELEGSFDAVFSSATLHWCKRSPEGVVRLVKWLLKPGGRMTFEFGGFGNCLGVRAALHHALRRRGVNPMPLDPWYFPTAAQYTKLLDAVGMSPRNVHLVSRPTPLPTSLAGWLQTFARSSFLSTFSDEEAKDIIDEVVDICRVDNYWSDECPGIGVAPAPAVPGSRRQDGDMTGEAKTDGWEVFYVRLRGVAFKPELE